MQTEAFDGEKRDLPRRGWARNIKDAKPCRKRLRAFLQRVGERLAEIILLLRELLHRPNVGTVDDEEQIVMDLKMV